MSLTIVDAEVWCCDICTQYLANGDLSEIDYCSGDDQDRADAWIARVQAGAERVAAEGYHWLPNWDSESSDGTEDFSRRDCECCGTHLAGRRTRWALAADTDTVCVTTGCRGKRAKGRKRCERCLTKQAIQARARRASRAEAKAQDDLRALKARGLRRVERVRALVAAELKARRASQKTGA